MLSLFKKERQKEVIEVYTKVDCPACNSIKQMLNSFNASYAEYTIGLNITREEVLDKFPNARTVPIIVYDNEIVAGAAEMKTLLENGAR